MESVCFGDLNFSKPPFREGTRGNCNSCGNRSWGWCSSCEKLADNVDPNDVPCLQLGVHVTVVRHSLENRKKSTAIPASLLSSDISLIMETDIDGVAALNSEGEETVLLFPDEHAVPVAEIDWAKVTNVVAIDSTWTQAIGIRSNQLPSLKTVKLQSYSTMFWRYNDKSMYRGDECLSTVEAIYFLLRERHKAILSQQSRAISTDMLDDLLYFYEAQWFQVSKSTGKANTLEVGKGSRNRRDQLRLVNQNKAKEDYKLLPA